MGNDGGKQSQTDVVNIGYLSILANPNYLLAKPSLVEERLNQRSEHQTLGNIAETKMKTILLLGISGDLDSIYIGIQYRRLDVPP